MDKIKILILAANPLDTGPLALGEEYQRIQDLWKMSDLRGQFELHLCPAVRADAIQQEILDFKPNIIHFSGHGDIDGLALADINGAKSDWLDKETLGNLFKLCSPHLKAVLLNACHSAERAEAIIDHAFNAGLNRMEIDHIDPAERQKPVLQKRRQTYVPSYQHDVFISFADEDAEFAKGLIDYLYKKLKQKLETADDFQLHTDNDFNQLEKSATLLVIATPAYCQQYSARFAQLGQLAKQQPVFLVEYEACKTRPEFLKGVTPYKFWLYDDSEGMKSVTGEVYFAKADELVSAMTKRLTELKAQQQRHQDIEQEREKQKQESSGQTIPVSVFLDSAPEDLALTNKIKSLLKEKGVECVIVPIERTNKVSAEDISLDSKNKISQSDAVLVLYDQTSALWASKQILDCILLQRKRMEPLKIIALHKGQGQPDLGIESNKVKIYSCPPEQVETYLVSFIEALK